MMIRHSRETIQAVCAAKGRKSAAIVAREFGLASRMAVVGLWNRNMGRPQREAAEVTPGKLTLRPGNPKAPRRPRQLKSPNPRPVLAMEPDMIVVTTDSTATVAAILSIRYGECRFPLGDAGDDDFRFCCEPARAGSVYCSEHAARCYRDGPEPSTFRRPAAAVPA